MLVQSGTNKTDLVYLIDPRGWDNLMELGVMERDGIGMDRWIVASCLFCAYIYMRGGRGAGGGAAEKTQAFDCRCGSF